MGFIVTVPNRIQDLEQEEIVVAESLHAVGVLRIQTARSAWLEAAPTGVFGEAIFLRCLARAISSTMLP